MTTTPPAADGAPNAPSDANRPAPRLVPKDEPEPGQRAEIDEAATTETPAEGPTAADASLPRHEPTDSQKFTVTPTNAPTIGAVLPLPPPQLAAMTRYRQASVSFDGLFTDGYHVAAGSLAGSAHLTAGTPRQDAYDFLVTSTGRLVIAVADGMGSRPHSQVGARLFCEGICLAAAASPNDAATKYLAWANDYVIKVCRDHQLALDEISYVAALAVFDRDECEVLRIGDVSAFALTEDGFTELFIEQEGHLNVVTTSLPADPLPPPESFCSGEVRRVVLCTDGLANDIRSSAQVRKWLQECWTHLLDAYGMAEAMRFRRRGSHDDRTAVLATVKFSEESSNSDDRIKGTD